MTSICICWWNSDPVDEETSEDGQRPGTDLCDAAKERTRGRYCAGIVLEVVNALLRPIPTSITTYCVIVDCVRMCTPPTVPMLQNMHHSESVLQCAGITSLLISDGQRDEFRFAQAPRAVWRRLQEGRIRDNSYPAHACAYRLRSR